jgi:hypothetical protein
LTLREQLMDAVTGTLARCGAVFVKVPKRLDDAISYGSGDVAFHMLAHNVTRRRN